MGDFGIVQQGPGALRLAISTNGNVGIGTSTPTTALHVTTDAPNAGVARFDNRHPGGFSGIYFDQTNQMRGWVGYVNSESVFGGQGMMQLGGAGSLVFSAQPGGLFSERMRINGTNGNVGIGTTNPTTRLHVDGTVTATGKVFKLQKPVALLQI